MSDCTWYAAKGPNGDLTWRVESPARAVGAKVSYIPEGPGLTAVYYPNTGKHFPWIMRGHWEDGTLAQIRSKKDWERNCALRRSLLNVHNSYPLQEGEAAVFTRPLSWLAAHMLEMKSQGIRVCAEVDDFYLGDKHMAVFTKADKTEDWDDYLQNHGRSILSGDGLIFSTDYLRDSYWKALRKVFPGMKQHFPEFFVCRNHIDMRYFPTERVPPRADGKLRIGFMGSDSHFWDVELIYPALREAYEQGHEIVFMGTHPGYAAWKPSAYEEAHRSPWWEMDITFIPWENTFRRVALPFDIGFAPLQGTRFTWGKSDIKWMEYALSGAACIAQNNVVYNKTAFHGETALLAGSPWEFVLQMRELIKSRSLRERLVANTLQYINENRLIENNADEWSEAVYGVRGRATGDLAAQPEDAGTLDRAVSVA